MIGIEEKGAKEVSRMLKRLEKKDVSKIAKSNTRKAQKEVMIPAIRGNATDMVGGKMGALLAKNLTVRAMTRMQRGSYGHKVILKATDAFVYEAEDGTRSYIPSAIEYGHAAPYDAGGTKVAKAAPFQRDAYEKKRIILAERLRRDIISDIERAAKAK